MPGPALTNFFPLVRETCDSLLKSHQQRVENVRLRRSEDQFLHDNAREQATWTGSQRMESIMHMCTTWANYELSAFQQMCLRKILECMAPVIFGNPPANELALHLRKHRMEVLGTQFVMIGTSRRGGKTDIMTMACAAMLAHVPHLQSLYYSLFDITCEAACNSVYKWLCEAGLKSRIKSKRKNRIVLRGDADGDERTVVFLNGQNPDVSPLTHPPTHPPARDRPFLWPINKNACKRLRRACDKCAGLSLRRASRSCRAAAACSAPRASRSACA